MVVSVLWVYNRGKDKGHRALARRVMELSSKGGPPETIEGLKEAIALYEDQIEKNVSTGAQTGVYWKILAIRLADRGMHIDALAAIERALYFNSADPTLFYLTGEYASSAAAAALNFRENSVGEKERYTNLAETSYLRAIQLDPSYAKPHFGLGLLYTFDMDRPQDAIPHLEHFLQLSPNNIEGMFVLARAFYMTEKYDSAADLYDKIISKSKDQKVKSEALKNRDIVRDLMYE